MNPKKIKVDGGRRAGKTTADQLKKVYEGDWYGTLCNWHPYWHIKTEDDPNFWPDEHMRVKASEDHRENGGFALAWALTEGFINEKGKSK